MYPEAVHRWEDFHDTAQALNRSIDDENDDDSLSSDGDQEAQLELARG
jgi:hypothetical protein